MPPQLRDGSSGHVELQAAERNKVQVSGGTGRYGASIYFYASAWPVFCRLQQARSRGK
jgi:hypothetical protein